MIFSLLLVTSLLCVCNATILDQYVHAPDPTYKYRVVNKFVPPLFDITVYNIELTSCSWLTPKDTSTHIWKHWLQISIPHNLRRTDTGFLYIDGGSNPVNASHPPVVFDSETKFVGPFVSEATGVVTSVLMQIPNEPARFPDDNPPNKRRTEDAIIAYTWRRVVNGSSPEWFLRLPMTKAVVKAMDTIEHFTQNVVKNVTPVKKFIVAGASKRGWTTWTTMAVDTRVVAAVPIVMPGLDLRPTFNNAYRELGGWSFALKDYIDEGLMGFLNLPEWKKIEDVVDPYTYLKRYTMPKMLVAATGDEFFPLDSERHWWSDLPGPKALSLVANAEHSLASGIIDVASAIGAFVYLIVEDKGLPEYSWEVTRSNGTSVSGHLAKTVVNVAAAARPFLKSVQSWKANTLSSTQRDFRLIKCRDIGQGGCFNPVFWWPTTLSPVAPGRYEATSDAPSYGWSAFLIELIFEYPDPITQRNHTLTVTTQSNIVPDMVPFGPCGFECACGTKCPPKP